MSEYDGLNVCAECGDAYTTGTLCRACARQRAIDNDPMAGYDAPHYSPVYGYDDDDGDDDGDDDDEDLLDWYSEDDGLYDDDETIDLRPTLKWKLLHMKYKLKWLWIWKLSHPVHRLRMKYDKRYRDSYWTEHIPF